MKFSSNMALFLSLMQVCNRNLFDLPELYNIRKTAFQETNYPLAAKLDILVQTLVVLVCMKSLVLSSHFLCSSLLIGSSKTDHKLLSHLATHNCIL